MENKRASFVSSTGQIGDRRNLALTKKCIEWGWTPPPIKTAHDKLPLCVQYFDVLSSRPRVFLSEVPDFLLVPNTIPINENNQLTIAAAAGPDAPQAPSSSSQSSKEKEKDKKKTLRLVKQPLELTLSHPEYRSSTKALGLKWPSAKISFDHGLSIGGYEYPSCIIVEAWTVSEIINRLCHPQHLGLTPQLLDAFKIPRSDPMGYVRLCNHLQTAINYSFDRIRVPVVSSQAADCYNLDCFSHLIFQGAAPSFHQTPLIASRSFPFDNFPTVSPFNRLSSSFTIRSLLQQEPVFSAPFSKTFFDGLLPQSRLSLDFNAPDSPSPSSSPDIHRKKQTVLILFGSESGTSERFAFQLAREVSEITEVSLMTINDFLDEENGSSLADLQNYIATIFITSTTGAGIAPENATHFVHCLNQSQVHHFAPHQLKFSVFGLGSSAYPGSYCSFSRLIDSTLEQLGGTRFHQMASGDALFQQHETFCKWKTSLCKSLSKLVSLSTPVIATSGLQSVASKLSKRRSSSINPLSLLLPSKSSFEGEGSRRSSASSRKDSTNSELTFSETDTDVETDTEDEDGLDLFLSHSNSSPQSSPRCGEVGGVVFSIDEFPASKNLSEGDVKISFGPVSKDWPWVGVVQSKKLLLHDERAHRSLVEIDVDVSGSGIRIEAGDHVGIYPSNPREVVDTLSDLLKIQSDDIVIDREIIDSHLKHSLHFRQTSTRRTRTGEVGDCILGSCQLPTTLRTLLTHYLNIFTSAEMLASMFRQMARSCIKKKDTKQLRAFGRKADSNPESLLEQFPSVVSVLEAYPSVQIKWWELVDCLSPLQPRPYSIASATHKSPDDREVTMIKVIVASAFIWPKASKGSGKHKEKDGPTPIRSGLCSHFLMDRKEGNTLRIFAQSSKMRLPSSVEAPIVLFSIGSAISPFLGLLEERRNRVINEQKKISCAPGKSLLFYGCRDQDNFEAVSHFLKPDLDAQFLSKLFVSYSRALPGKSASRHKYIQEALDDMETKEDVSRLFEMAETTIYICGDSSFAMSIEEKLIGVLQDTKDWPRTRALEFIQNLKKEQRFIVEAWGLVVNDKFSSSKRSLEKRLNDRAFQWFKSVKNTK